MLKDEFIRKWGWDDPDDCPGWINKMAEEYEFISQENFKLGQILVFRGLAEESEVEGWLASKQKVQLLGDFIEEQKNVSQRLRGALLSAIAASSVYQLPYYDAVFEKEGISIASDLYSDDVLKAECNKLSAVVLECNVSGRFVLVFSSLPDYERFRQRAPGDLLGCPVTKRFGNDIRFGVANGQTITDALRDISSGKVVRSNDGFDLLESEMLRSGEPQQVALAKALNAVISNGGSDIHITPLLESDAVVIEGRFKTRLKPLSSDLQVDRELYFRLRDFMVSKSKATEHGAPVFVPVDGAALDYHRKSGEKVRLRASFMPLGVDGSPEKNPVRIVCRFSPLDADVRQIDDLNLNESAEQYLEDVVETKGKMAIMVAPMGSGKTTTMYAVLQGIRDKYGGSRCIVSLENPVEQIVSGIHQIQITVAARKAGLGYDYYLKNLKRQDTNVVYLGEIRDKDTAENAAQFSAIGNKIVTTLHGDDEIEGSLRLMTMVERRNDQQLLVSNMSHVFTQRVVPVLCHECKKEVDFTDEMKKRLERILRRKAPFEVDKVMSEIPGKVFVEGEESCGHCNDERILGVKPVLGVLEIDEETRELLLFDAPGRKKKLADKRAITMIDQILSLIKSGDVSLEALDL